MLSAFVACALSACAASPAPEPQAAPVATPANRPTVKQSAQQSDPPRSQSETTIIREPKLDTEPLDCTGEVSDALNQELGVRAGETKLCYEKLLSRDPDARGRMLVAVTFDERGNVASYRIEQGAFGDKEFAGCVEQIVGSPVHDTLPVKGCVNVQIPLNYQPTTEGEASAPKKQAR